MNGLCKTQSQSFQPFGLQRKCYLVSGRIRTTDKRRDMNSKSIYTCQNCDQLFCAECSNADDEDDFCSSKCQVEYEENSGC